MCHYKLCKSDKKIAFCFDNHKPKHANMQFFTYINITSVKAHK